MSRRISSFGNALVGIEREIGSEYDTIKTVADNIDSIIIAAQGAITAAERAKLATIESNAKDDQSAAEVPYSNITSGLTAIQVQAALDEVVASLGNGAYFDFTPGADPVYQEGRVYYSSTDNTLNYQTDDPDVTVNIGQEFHIKVRNNTGVTITNGSVVYLSGAVGQRPTIALAQADNYSTASVIGVATHDIGNNSNGYVTIAGIVRGLNTSAYSDGQDLYLDTTTPGTYTTTKPSNRTGYPIRIAKVSYSHVSNGQILVLPNRPIDVNDVNNAGAARASWTTEAIAFDATVAHLQPNIVKTGVACSIDTEANAGWLVGDSITLLNTGAAQAASFAAKAGVTLQAPSGILTAKSTNSIISAIYEGSNVWYITGDLG